MPTEITASSRLYPLILHNVPPGLVLMLVQEGVSFEIVDSLSTPRIRAARFVLFDARRTRLASITPHLAPGQVAIDVDKLRSVWSGDPFEAMIDHGHARNAWRIEGTRVVEHVARFDKARIRDAVLGALRSRVRAAGSPWIHIAPFPYPYRSAFNLRVDLDECQPSDYARFARARIPIATCTTHFVSTAAYATEPNVIRDLRRHDTQSHGHFHHTYRSREANRRNLQKADSSLRQLGITPVGFAAPGGRWNVGLDNAIAELGYTYSSEFQFAYDDLPSRPYHGGRFSQVLQVPVHPICEGLFFDAGVEGPNVVGDYLARVIRRKVVQGMPAFIYGHPERRLGRFPGIVELIAHAVAGESLVWRTTLTEFARWWLKRERVRWSVDVSASGELEVRVDSDLARDRLAFQIHDETHVAAIPIEGRVVHVVPGALAYERRALRADWPEPRVPPPPMGMRSLLRRALDWETVTPIEHLPEATLLERTKKRIRRWRASGRP